MKLLPLWGSLAGRFLTDQSNIDAFNLIKRPDVWPDRILILYGSWGKSHLARILHTEHQYEYLVPSTSSKAERLIWDNFSETRCHDNLLHDWNQIVARKASLCITMRNAPQAADIRPPDLKSRMASALSVRIKPAGYALRHKIFVQWLGDCDVEIDQQALRYFFTHYDADLPLLVTRAEKLRNHGLLYQCPITIKRIQECLGEVL
jgi:hypothetical protein